MTTATFLEQAVAVVRDSAATAQVVAGMAWAWIVAQPLWLSISMAVGVKLAIVVPVAIARRRARPAAPGIVHVTPKARRAKPLTTALRATPSASAAIELMSHGLPVIEIARRTGMSRDAVSLVLAMAGSIPARQGSPVPAGVAATHVPEPGGRRSRRPA